jgi:Uma2 family endonuclease
MSSQPTTRLTPEEYLARERVAETRSEYYQGEVYLMTGASRNHNLITINVVSALHSQLRGRPCELYASDMRVKVSRTGLYTYPDVVVVCGRPRFDDEHKDTLLNPNVLVEVLSPSTEAYDRGAKFQQYRKLESLTDYLLIAQDSHHIEHFVRQQDDQWLLSEATSQDAIIHLDSIGCDLALGLVYEKIEFE